MLRLGCILSVSILVAPALYAADPAPAASAAPATAPKMRCKYYTEIGSLAKTHKECHTALEWDQMAQGNRMAATNYVNSAVNSTRPDTPQ